jgi:hypothetical protein
MIVTIKTQNTILFFARPLLYNGLLVNNQIFRVVGQKLNFSSVNYLLEYGKMQILLPQVHIFESKLFT